MIPVNPLVGRDDALLVVDIGIEIALPLRQPLLDQIRREFLFCM